jgi:hypothetical protein
VAGAGHDRPKVIRTLGREGINRFDEQHIVTEALKPKGVLQDAPRCSALAGVAGHHAAQKDLELASHAAPFSDSTSFAEHKLKS